MEKDFSFDKLLKFLEYTIDKGLLNHHTATGRRTACLKILNVLDASEKTDLSTIDLKSAFNRFINKNPNLHKQRSLKEYQSRVEKSIDDFLAYTKDPLNWKPSSQQRKNIRRLETEEPPVKHQAEPSPPTSATGKTLTFPFPIREDITITISNIPRDLKISEAKRLSAFLETLSTDFKPVH